MAWIILSRCKPPPMSVQGGFWKKGSRFIQRHTQELRLLVVSEVSMDMSVFQRVPLPDTRLFILIPAPLVLLRGVIAIENIAVGVLFTGGISFSLFSFGGLAFSILLSLGGVSSSLIFTLGVLLSLCVLRLEVSLLPMILPSVEWLSPETTRLRLFNGKCCHWGRRQRSSIYWQTGTGDYLLRLTKIADQTIDFVTSRKVEISTLFEWIIRTIY